MGLYTESFSHSGGMHHSENWVKGVPFKKCTYLCMAKWDMGFEELGQIIFRKEYLGKLNINEIDLFGAVHAEILVLKFEMSRAVGCEWN